MNTKLNSLVAERVMGWKLRIKEDKGIRTDWWGTESDTEIKVSYYWTPSTDLNDALAALEKVAGDSEIVIGRNPVGEWWCHICGKGVRHHKHSLPIAVCYAALRASGVSESEIQSAMEE